MASERLIALQAEIEAKQREVERIIAEEARKNAMPPLAAALEEVLSAQAFADEASTRKSKSAEAYNRMRRVDVVGDQRAWLASCARAQEREYLDGNDEVSAGNAATTALMYEDSLAADAAGERLVAAKDKMLKALLDQALEDAKTKRDNANMFETLFAQMRALQARVTTLEEEKVVKDRIAEETIRSLGYSTGY
jgi:hypothetical protein